ncbi:unnamed protein product [Bathycoccus prasinos]
MAPMGKTAVDALAWSLNIFSSVAIVMVNKQLMSSTGYGFRFATTLCGLHFFCTAFINLCVKREKSSASSSGDASASQTGLSEKLMESEQQQQQQQQKLPLKDLVFYVVVANMSIIGLNVSLMLNTIGFYQVCKLAQIPTMCILEASFLNKKFSRKVVQAIIVVLAGVAVATVSDVEMNVTGTVAASVGVLSTSAQQILVGHLQKKHNVTSNFLLAKTSLWMAASMLVFGPIMDTLVTGGGKRVRIRVDQWEFDVFSRLVRVRGVVIGHVKTVLVFLFGFICFNAPITSKNIAGCALAVVGMIYYTQAMNKQKEDEAKGVGMIHSGSSSANLSAKCRALFTGIVQGTATVTSFTPIQGGLFARLTLTFPNDGENQRPLEKLTIGASIAVNGTCLTVVEFDEEKSTASFDMISETLRATNLGELRVDDVVNYERSTKFGEEIGGHVVSGHVHTTAEIYAEKEETENNREVKFRLRDREIVKYILPKGFVAVDGCSLTVGEVDEKEGTFNVWLIPETIRATAFRVKSVGNSVNIEIESSTRAIVDTIERYMERKEKEKTG